MDGTSGLRFPEAIVRWNTDRVGVQTIMRIAATYPARAAPAPGRLAFPELDPLKVIDPAIGWTAERHGEFLSAFFAMCAKGNPAAKGVPQGYTAEEWIPASAWETAGSNTMLQPDKARFPWVTYHHVRFYDASAQMNSPTQTAAPSPTAKKGGGISAGTELAVMIVMGMIYEMGLPDKPSERKVGAAALKWAATKGVNAENLDTESKSLRAVAAAAIQGVNLANR